MKNSGVSKRSLIGGIGAAATPPALSPGAAKESAKWTPGAGMPQEGPTTPKIAAPVNGRDVTDEAMREVKQIGVNNVLTGGPRMPWEDAELRAFVDTLKSGGLALGNMMIGGFPNTLYGKPGRDEEIEKFKLRSKPRAKPAFRSSNTIFTPIASSKAITPKRAARARESPPSTSGRMKDLPPLPGRRAHTRRNVG